MGGNGTTATLSRGTEMNVYPGPRRALRRLSQGGGPCYEAGVPLVLVLYWPFAYGSWALPESF